MTKTHGAEMPFFHIAKRSFSSWSSRCARREYSPSQMRPTMQRGLALMDSMLKGGGYTVVETIPKKHPWADRFRSMTRIFHAKKSYVGYRVVSPFRVYVGIATIGFDGLHMLDDFVMICDEVTHVRLARCVSAINVEWYSKWLVASNANHAMHARHTAQLDLHKKDVKTRVNIEVRTRGLRSVGVERVLYGTRARLDLSVKDDDGAVAMPVVRKA